MCQHITQSIRYDTIIILTCAEKLARSQLNLPHRTRKKIIQNQHSSEQVAQLSMTNPRERCITTNGKILKQSRDHKHALSLVICHPVARIDIAYLCTKFDDFRFSRSSDMIRAQNKNSSGDEIANVNFLTTISHTHRPRPT